MSLKNLTLQCISSRDSANPFVEQAVQYVIAAAHALLVDKVKKDVLLKLLMQGQDITILGSNDFYSYRNQIEARGLPLTPDALASLPQFSSITFNVGGSNEEKCKPEVAKIGLGSSAAMTTAVVAALLHYLGVVNLPFSDKTLHQEDCADLDLVHVVAQTAHCMAQGKVGSGFDVSAAVYGLMFVHAVGFATIAAMIVIVLTVLCNAPLAKLQHKFQTKVMVAQDERLKAMGEALVNMKVLKLYAWEIHFKNVIEGLRNVEYTWLSAVQL